MIIHESFINQLSVKLKIYLGLLKVLLQQLKGGGGPGSGPKLLERRFSAMNLGPWVGHLPTT